MVDAWHLAQINIARVLAPVDDPRLADFMAALDEINALAETSPGFVWRLQTEEGNATSIHAFDDPDLLVNMSVWEDADSLFAYVYKTVHARFMARRREWFDHRFDGPYQVLWWIPAGHVPTVEEGKVRLRTLAERGPTAEAFTFKQRFPAPASAEIPVAGE